MTAPVKYLYLDQYGIQPEPQVKPSSRPKALEQADYPEYQEFEGEEFGNGGDQFVDSSGEFGEGAPLTADSVRQHLSDLLEMLQVSDLSAEEQKEIRAEIAALEGKINTVASLGEAAKGFALGKIQEKMFEVEGRIMGNGEAGLGGSLKTQLEAARKKCQDDKNLTAKKRSELIEKIDRWISTLELGASEEMEAKIMEDFQTLQEEYANASLHTGAASSLAELTGMDPGEIEALAKKHGLDLKNLPNPPDSKVAAFIGELPNIGAPLEEVRTKYSELKSKIDSATSSANAINQANQASDTSVKDSVDWTPFKDLYNAKFHRDDASYALAHGRTALAKEVANVLGSLYDEEVTVMEDPAKGGMVSFNGIELNVLGKGGASTKVGFSTGEPEWPSVDLVEVFVDNEGDGKTGMAPSWMRNAYYPFHIYDGGHKENLHGGGNWAWGGDIQDIGHEV